MKTESEYLRAVTMILSRDFDNFTIFFFLTITIKIKFRFEIRSSKCTLCRRLYIYKFLINFLQINVIIIYFFIIYFRRRILKKRFKNLGRSEQTNDILFQILNKIFPFLEILENLSITTRESS